MIKKYTNLSVIALSSLVLIGTTACGVKPDNVDPPAGAEDRPFPSSYPKNVSQ